MINSEANGNGGGVPKGDPNLLKEFQNTNIDIDESIQFLKNARLISEEKNWLTLLTRECKIVALPDGRIVAGDDESGRLTHWLRIYMDEFKS